MPWFGFQLAPGKSDTANHQRTIRQNRSAPAEQPKIQLTRGERITETSWPNWLTPSRQRPALPLPVTTGDDAESETAASTEPEAPSFVF